MRSPGRAACKACREPYVICGDCEAVSVTINAQELEDARSAIAMAIDVMVSLPESDVRSAKQSPKFLAALVRLDRKLLNASRKYFN
jgi:hypothetical protein